MDGFWGWVQENGWAAWASAGVVLAAAELVSLDFVLLMIASGMFAGAIGDAAGAPLPINIVLAIVVAVAMLGLVRPSILRRLHGGAHYVDGAQALIGQLGVVTARVDRGGGRIEMNGDTWTARPYDETAVIEPGTRVQVFEIDGATAVVYPEEM